MSSQDNLVSLVYDTDPGLRSFLIDSNIFTEEVFERIKFVENDIVENDIEYVLATISAHQRWIVDVIYMLKRWFNRESLSLEVCYGNLEVEVRSDISKKYTIAEVKALIYKGNQEYVDRLGVHTSVKELIDHLESLLKILFARKDIAVERSIDARSNRKADSQAL